MVRPVVELPGLITQNHNIHGSIPSQESMLYPSLSILFSVSPYYQIKAKIF